MSPPKSQVPPSRSKLSKERSTPARPVSAFRRPTRFMTQHDKELLKAERIKQKYPFLNKFETTEYRNSYIHNLCVKMLKEGFHQSFDELFTLNSNRNQERLDAGPDSILWEEELLETQHKKLDEICSYLTNAEYAARQGKWDDVYACRHALAQYFLLSGDFWLSDHFFKTALDISLNIKLDGRRRESEAHCHMGLACERKGEIEEACRHMLEFYHLTMGRLWSDEDDTNLHHISCRHLCRIYSKLAGASAAKADLLSNLHKAFDVSKEGEDKLQEAGVAYQLGCAYEASHDSETAIQYLEQCLTISTEFKDHELIGKACESLAKSHQTLGGIPKALGFLEMFAATSKISDRKLDLIDACSCLGTIYNSLGKYGESIQHFSESYDVIQELHNEQEQSAPSQEDEQSQVDRLMLEECALQLGVAKGNQLLNAFSSNMEILERNMMERIIAWKDERIDEFGQPIPKPSPPPIVEPEKVPDPTEPFRMASESDQT